MFVDPFVGSHIRAIIAELRRLSGGVFPHECVLDPNDDLGFEERFELSRLVHGKAFFVTSLRELSTSLHAVESSLCWNHRVKPGYERVFEKYHELLSMRWLIGASAYRKGLDSRNEGWSHTWVYGLVDVDSELLDEFRAVLNEVENEIRNTPFPDLVDRFSLAYLTNDLIQAGVPTSGLISPQAAPTPERDSTPCEYFELHDGKFARMMLTEGVVLTGLQKEDAGRIIRDHMNRCDDLNRILQSLDVKIRRAGIATSVLHFVRTESELALAPERSVSLDTDRGFLEIRTPERMTQETRTQIQRIAQQYLGSEGVNALLGDEFPTSAVHVVERVLKRFHFASRSLARRRAGKTSFLMVDEYDVQDLLRAILEVYFDDVVTEDPNPKFAGKSTRVDFVLKKAKVFIEVKRPREDQRDGDVSDDLIDDVPHYRQRADCQTLFFFVFDPDQRITQPTMFKADLESLGTADMAIRVVVNQN